jgi:hypothetical protein
VKRQWPSFHAVVVAGEKRVLARRARGAFDDVEIEIDAGRQTPSSPCVGFTGRTHTPPAGEAVRPRRGAGLAANSGLSFRFRRGRWRE